MSIRAHIKAWTPPAIVDARRHWLGHTLRFGDAGDDWAAAERQSSGYAADVIVDRVAQATREVIAGRAVFERDSVLFHEPDYRYPIVAALLHCAQANNGRLDVIDFGGSLGSTYRQCKPLLDGVQRVALASDRAAEASSPSGGASSPPTSSASPNRRTSCRRATCRR